MATVNPFDLLGDNENDDPSQFVVAPQQKMVAKKPAAPGTTAPTAAKLPTKSVPPAQAVRELRGARSNAAPPRGGDGRAGLGRGRGGRDPSREFGNENVNGFSRSYGIVGGGVEDGDADKPEKARPARIPFGGDRRGGYGGRGGYGNDESGGDAERPPRRLYDRRSGTGRSYEVKRQGAGRGNWGTVADEALSQVKEHALKSDEKPTDGNQERENAPLTEESKDKEDVINATEEKEEDKEMTLEEYEKIKEEKRKALLSLKAEERKVEIDKELQSMQQLTTKKEMDPIFVKLGFDKDVGKKKENVDRDDRNKKPLNINELFMTGEGNKYYSPASRGHGRGRGDHAPFRGGFGGRSSSLADATPSIEDPSQFPMLSAKDAIKATEQIESPAIGAIIKQNNAKLQLIVQIAESVKNIQADVKTLVEQTKKGVQTTSIPDELVDKLKILSLGPTEKPKEARGMLRVFKDPYEILKEEQEKLKK